MRFATTRVAAYTAKRRGRFRCARRRTYSAKDYKGALSIVEPRAEQQTDNLALQRLLARCQKQLGLLEKAAETFARIASTSKDAAPL